MRQLRCQHISIARARARKRASLHCSRASAFGLRPSSAFGLLFGLRPSSAFGFTGVVQTGSAFGLGGRGLGPPWGRAGPRRGPQRAARARYLSDSARYLLGPQGPRGEQLWVRIRVRVRVRVRISTSWPLSGWSFFSTPHKSPRSTPSEINAVIIGD